MSAANSTWHPAWALLVGSMYPIISSGPPRGILFPNRKLLHALLGAFPWRLPMRLLHCAINRADFPPNLNFMSIQNYAKSRVPITDLSNYSLSLNDNIPTYSAPLPSVPRISPPTLPKLSLPKPVPQAPKQLAPNNPPKPYSKLDLLLQTAAMHSVQSEKPANQTATPNYVLDPKTTHASPKLEISNLVIQTTPQQSSAPELTSIKLASPSAASKRQRSGPSCDCCRARKIKCDSEIFVLAELPETRAAAAASGSEIASCKFLYEDENRYQYFEIDTSQYQHQRFNSKLSRFRYLKFKPCSACRSKKLVCCFSKGFTRNDIIKFNKSERLHQTPEKDEPKDEVALPIMVGPYGKHPKKTSCNTCRFKKIKCIKLENNPSSDCLGCSKKHLECAYV
ncbi:hypothetical protein KL932_001835 [Ogataea haglerorum]|nr:hypothetical protein KL932_001835 [Ogataea haglerorum]KAG7808890.1 hypothetical protein KL924_002944 [Ogataea haglerorum]